LAAFSLALAKSLMVFSRFFGRPFTMFIADKFIMSEDNLIE
jgi:hypothetical protein